MDQPCCANRSCSTGLECRGFATPTCRMP
jgi:hypothetical protein